MITTYEGSATIYQFPKGGRDGVRGKRIVDEASLPRGSALTAGESWYHAEAIQEAKQATT